MMNEWCLVGNEYWWYGEKIRGVVRKPLAQVKAQYSENGTGKYWEWAAHKPDGYMSGSSNSMVEAIEKVEKELGVVE